MNEYPIIKNQLNEFDKKYIKLVDKINAEIESQLDKGKTPKQAVDYAFKKYKFEKVVLKNTKECINNTVTEAEKSG
jgi:hypothetical protein